MNIISNDVINVAEKYFYNDINIAQIWFKKYGVNNETPLDVWKRLAKIVSEVESPEEEKEWENNFYDILKDWKFVPGGRILFGITEDIKNKNRRKVTPFNCFFVGQPKDNLEDIFEIAKRSAKIYSYGGGVGIDLSKLRPSGSKVNNSAIFSDGIIPFMNIYSEITGNIAISGRRGALMITLDIKHPDILNFINIKKDLSKINYANISVKVSDEFMKCVEESQPWEVYFKVDATGEEIKKSFNARDIFNNIIVNNWQSAEPGVLFWDRVTSYTPNQYFSESQILGTNPCLVGDTKILISQDDNFKEIKIIDFLNLFNKNKSKKFYILSYNFKTKKIAVDIVKNVFKTKDNAKILEVILENNVKINLTPDHNIYVYGKGFISADKLELNDLCYYRNDNKIKKLKVIEVKECQYKKDVYDITTEKYNNFFANNILVHNCSEQPLPENGCCNLGSINLTKFVKYAFTNRAEFDFDSFKTTIQYAVRFLDNINELAIKYNLFPHQEQLEECIKTRRIGLGVMGLADVFVMLNLKYGSIESLNFSDKLFAFLRDTAYDYSITLSSKKGPFKIFNAEKWLKSRFIANLPFSIQERGKINGIRNLTLLSIAPTGSLALLAGVSCGIEPIFSLEYFRTIKLGYNNQNQTIKFYHPLYKKFIDKGYENNKNVWVTAYQIDWLSRIKLQGIIQKYICTSISSTINLPSNTTKEDIYNIYMTAWKEGLKGITIYRDGCRENVLQAKKKRPRELIGKTYQIKDENNNTYYITINNAFEDLNFKPFEIFVNSREINDYINVITRLISAIFRRTKEPEFVVKQILKSTKDQNSFLYQFANVIAEHMGLDFKTFLNNCNFNNKNDFDLNLNKNNILKNTGLNLQICPKCNLKTLKKEGGCEECLNSDCGYGKCSL